MHVIKQKPHHRLFDLTAHRYVSPQGVRCLADSGEEIHVIDARTGRDVTRRVLPRLLAGEPEHSRTLGGDLVGGAADALTNVIGLAMGLGSGAAQWLAGGPAALADAVKQGFERVARALHVPRTEELRRFRTRLSLLEARIRRLDHRPQRKARGRLRVASRRQT